MFEISRVDCTSRGVSFCIIYFIHSYLVKDQKQNAEKKKEKMVFLILEILEIMISK